MYLTNTYGMVRMLSNSCSYLRENYFTSLKLSRLGLANKSEQSGLRGPLLCPSAFSFLQMIHVTGGPVEGPDELLVRKRAEGRS